MNVLDQAQNFSGGPVAAARKRDRWARQEANATDEETRAQYREAIADLEARYPDIEDVPIGGAEAFARERGHGSGARSPVHEGRRRPASGGAPARSKPKGVPAPRAKGKAPKPTPGLDPAARRGSTQRRAAKGRSTPRVDSAIRQTGVPAAISTSGSWTMAALGATVGLGLLFLILSSAEKPGTGALPLLHLVENRIPRALGRFLSPYEDVFPSGSSSSAGSRNTPEPTRHERAEHAGRVPQPGVPRGPRQTQRGRAR